MMWEIPGVANIFSFVSKAVEFDLNPLFNGIKEPFFHLNKQIELAIKSLISPPFLYEEWNYTVDPVTGLEVLKVKKDPIALNRILKIAEELYK